MLSSLKGGGEHVEKWRVNTAYRDFKMSNRAPKSGVSRAIPIRGTRKRTTVTSDPTKADGGVVRRASDERRVRKICSCASCES